MQTVNFLPLDYPMFNYTLPQSGDISHTRDINPQCHLRRTGNVMQIDTVYGNLKKCPPCFNVRLSADEIPVIERGLLF